MGYHDTAGVGDVHIPYNWSYADQAAREGASGFTAADLGKLARQLDTNSLWMLISVTPTWIDIGGGGGSSDASRIVYSCRKATSGTITVGQAVRITGVSGGFVLIELAQADAAGTMPCFGVAAATITDSAEGNVCFLGKLENVDTSSWSVGDILYVSTTVAGGLTNTRPTGATSIIQPVAIVLEVHASTGILGVMGSGPANLPNLAEGKVWQGDSNGQPVESDLPVFGTLYQYESSESESSTTSTTPVNKVSLTTPTLPAGTYRIAWSFEWQHDSLTSYFLSRMQLDDTTDIMLQQQEPQDVNNWHLVSGFGHATLTAAAHTFDLDYGTSNALDTSYIRRARIEFWRVE